MRPLNLCFSIFVAWGIFGLVNECIFGEIEAGSCESAPIDIDLRSCENLFSLIRECLGM
jgi:hypothetical protein